MKNDNPYFKTKQISLVIAVVMFVSMFLPFLKLFAIERSLFELIEQGGKGVLLYSLLILILLFSVLSITKQYLYARICSGLILLACLFFPIDFYSGGDDVFTFTFNWWSEFLTSGAYILIISSILGVILINPNNK